MAKREPLKLPGTFEDALSDLMRTPPPPKPTKKVPPKSGRKKPRTSTSGH